MHSLNQPMITRREKKLSIMWARFVDFLGLKGAEKKNNCVCMDTGQKQYIFVVTYYKGARVDISVQIVASCVFAERLSICCTASHFTCVIANWWSLNVIFIFTATLNSNIKYFKHCMIFWISIQTNMIYIKGKPFRSGFYFCLFCMFQSLWNRIFFLFPFHFDEKQIYII